MLEGKESFWGRKLRAAIPQRNQLQGSLLHKVLGERLFASELWGFDRRSVAGGMALGVFISMTPTLGIHMITSALAALVLRVNIPTSLAACWVVNPLIAPIVYGLQYQIGVWLVGLPAPDAIAGGSAGVMKTVIRHARPLWVGSMVVGIPSALMTYLLVYLGWERVARFLARCRHRGSTHGDEP